MRREGSPAAGAGERLLAEVQPWIRKLARIGYIAKGVVYVLVGVLAGRAALSRTEVPEGADGALLTLLRQPFGQILLAIVVLGLIGFIIWLVVLAVKDPEQRGRDFRGVAVRIGYLITGGIHVGLAVAAVRLLLGDGVAEIEAGDDDQAQQWTALAMSQPFGRWAVIATGLVIVGLAVYELYRAATASAEGDRDLLRFPYEVRMHIERFARMGHAARAVVFGTIGWFLIQAGWGYDPDEARGLAGALESLERQPYGPYLLGVVAIGLAAYGLFHVAQGRYGVLSPR